MDIENKDPNFPHINESIRWRIIGYLEANKTQIETSKYYNVSQSAISKIYSKFKKKGDISDLSKCGRPKKISKENKKSMIEELIEKNNYISCHRISNELDNKIGKSTINNTLHELGFDFKKPKIVPLLTNKCINERKEWAQKWKHKKLTNVLYSDESYFYLFRSTLSKWVKENQTFYARKINPNKALMIWGCISWKGKSKICILEEGFRINKETYVQMLEEYLIPFINFNKSNYQNDKKKLHFIQDNARAHIAEYSMNWLQENNIDTPKYPANSPDMNPIEKVWKIIKDKIEKAAPTTLNELKHEIQKAWDGLELKMIQSLIEGARHRM